MVEMVLPNPIGGMFQGMQAGNAMTTLRNNNKIAELGPGLMAGDPNALNALAAIDPMKALQIQQNRETMDMRRMSFDREQREFDLRLEEYKRKASAEEKAAEAEKLKQGVFMASRAQSPEEWDAMMTEFGLTDLVGKFDMKDAYLRRYMTAAEILKADAENAPKYGAIPEGHMIGPDGTMQPVPNYQPEPPKPADDYQRYVQEEMAEGRTPMGRIEFANAVRGGGFEVTTADGTTIKYGVSSADSKPTTEGEKSAAGYLSRMRAAESIMDGLALDGTTSRSIASLLVAGSDIEGMVLSDEQSKLLQAQRDWVRAKLRKESGAVIGPEEMADEIRTYFPLPGESDAVVEQKRKSRLEAERQMEIMAGRESGAAGPATDAPASPEPTSGGAVEKVLPNATPEQQAEIKRIMDENPGLTPEGAAAFLKYRLTP